jgi:ferritin-like metal-binding protein YciE
MALFSREIHNLRELFVEQLRDLYDGEQQINEALPKLIEKANNPELKDVLRDHLEESRTHIERLEKIFQRLDQKPTGERCKGMKGILKEGDDLVGKAKDPAVIDTCIIVAAQRVEHYEVAGYGTVRTFAKQMGEESIAQLLEQTLNEEKQADVRLSEIANSTNLESRKAA